MGRQKPTIMPSSGSNQSKKSEHMHSSSGSNRSKTRKHTSRLDKKIVMPTSGLQRQKPNCSKIGDDSLSTRRLDTKIGDDSLSTEIIHVGFACPPIIDKVIAMGRTVDDMGSVI